jgi:hypothetical protein
LKATPPPKPGEPAKEQSYTIAEGTKDGDIEVLEVDEKGGTVKVNNYGAVMTLDFDKNGVKVASAPPPPGGMPHPGGNVPMPFPGGVMPAGGGTVPRPMRLPTPTGGSAAISPGGFAPTSAGTMPAYGNANAVGGGSVPISGAIPVQVHTQTQPLNSAAAQMTAEQQFLLVEAERMRLQQSGADKVFPPIPPTPLTGELNPGTGNTQTSGNTTRGGPTMPPRAPSLPPLINQKSF